MRWSVRTRLTAMYGGLILAIGVILLLINYALVREVLPEPGGFVANVEMLPGGVPPPGDGAIVRRHEPIPADAEAILVDGIGVYRSSVTQTVLLTSGIALAIAGGLAVLLSWLMAGHVLRPLHAITATARRLEAESLNRRINLDGPPDELKELADTFDGMLDRLAAAFEGQNRFVANASHELRTPLAVQRTLVEVAMADPDATPELRKLGEHLLHTNKRSERLIEGLLLLARSDQGLRGRTPVRLDEVTETVLLGSAALAEEHGVTITRDLRSRTVAGDPVLLERMVTNLVQNAIRYNERGGSVLVEVGDSPALRVVNGGPVVPAEALSWLFESFRRLERDRIAGSDGCGLGLSIVRSVARAHDGRVTATPGPSGGLNVVVELPAASTGQEPAF